MIQNHNQYSDLLNNQRDSNGSSLYQSNSHIVFQDFQEMIEEQSDKQQQDIEQFQQDFQESTKDDNHEDVALKYNQTKIDLVRNYQKKIEKFNRLLEGKRVVNKPNQVEFIPVSLINEKIDINYRFYIFGHIEIPTNLDSLESSQQICCQTIYQKSSSGIQVKFDKALDFFEFSSNNVSYGINQFQFLCDFLSSQNSKAQRELALVLEKYQQEVNLILSKQKYFQKISSQVYQEIEEDYQQFSDYVKYKASQLEKGTIFKYLVGRMNYYLGDIEITKFGLCQEYLKLIGVNKEILEYTFMRGNPINMENIFKSSYQTILKDVQKRIENDLESLTVYFNIVTFDGFNLDLQLTTTKIASPFTRHQQTPYDHIGYIEQIYVPPNQLEALKTYRQNLAHSKNCITYDQYLNLEISKLFECVEYSVFSEMFLDKYYSQPQKKY
ncbi:hypothetical protein TTHERM_00797840 (macronuclear) [Tetrahymena thermophila SB210]|uniref:Uncharacterized protein n=1 Tax=Tetrahymena thermophila (strain SB210) TaxID=312017 RepID=Q23UE0_TETTS|nr:hypothetical protein TTHERM_00797840 [Tetrahymena thermophila SB210]EAS00125.1 hypothetical protein TTHERM_00797840 [Tetrahymena thermophila SB210]|eukprot:XP_001020370.1 hypothetical protein TTHERM_00797840 [Tetrahymena thermophila SB210]